MTTGSEFNASNHPGARGTPGMVEMSYKKIGHIKAILRHDIQNLVISYEIALKSALTFFTPYSSSVGGFNTTSIVPYISIPLSFGNTWLYEQLARCIYLKRVDKSRKILFFKPLLDFSHPMVVPWGVSTRSP